MSEIKAITTVYRGYKFRSRLEARWAVFFDALGVEWEYEPEGFILEDGTPYLPDFYTPFFGGGAYFEVKRMYEPNMPRCTEMLRLLSKLTEAPCYLLDGPPDIKPYKSYCLKPIQHESGEGVFSISYTEYQWHWGGESGEYYTFLDEDLFRTCNDHGLYTFESLDDYPDCFFGWNTPGEIFSERYKAAVAAARSARFEFDERSVGL